MIRTSDIHSLTDFTRNASKYVKQIRETKNPVALTVNGDAQVVVQDAAEYQEMVDELEKARYLNAIREGLKSAEEEGTIPLEDLRREMVERYGLPG